MITLLEARGICKRFGGLTALSDVSLTIRKGEVYGLIGPNGAGKTTFFNVLTGAYTPEEGELVFNGSELPLGKPHKVVEAGIARTFQNIRLFRDMTALENVMAGHHIRSRANPFSILLQTKHAKEEERLITERAYELLKYVGIERFADTISRNLSYGDQRRLEIARCMVTQPEILMLDEPAAGLNPKETKELDELIAELRNHHNTTILLIEHDMKLVMGISDRIYVVNQGTPLANGTPEEIRNNPDVIRAYLGEA